MTIQSSIFLRLLEQIPDHDLADRIKAQYFHDVESQANFVQNRVGDLEIDLREQVQQALGETNDMISEAVNLARAGGVALRELRSDFRKWIEQIVHISEDVDELRTRINEHDKAIASFAQSRDQSIADRAQLKTDLAESKADRASIHQELQSAKQERLEIMRQLADIQHMLRGRPNNDEAKRLVTLIHETKARVDRLERE